MPKQKAKVKKPMKPRTNLQANSLLRSFQLTNQKIDQKNFRSTRIHMPRRPK